MRLANEANGVVSTESGALSAAERQELMELRRKLPHTQLERDTLAKATGWFANNGDKTLPRLRADCRKSG